MSKKVYLVSSVGKRVQMLLNTWVVLLCNVVYVLVSLFSAQILYVYFCTDQFRIWIIDDKSLDVAVVPFFPPFLISLCCMCTDVLKLTMLNVLDSS